MWDITKRFSEVSGLPEQVVKTLQVLGAKLEAHASPSVQPAGFSVLFGQSALSGPSTTMLRKYEGNASYVCVCFADGSSRQVAANGRFEVLGRKRLQLQSVPAKDLEVGDQVVLLRDDERAAFSEELLKVMDKGKLREDSQTRSTWITMVRAVRATNGISATTVKQRLERSGFAVDLATVRSWLPAAGSEECGVPEHEDVFLAFAESLELVLPTATLKDWFAGIKRLRTRHRHAGRELAKAIKRRVSRSAGCCDHRTDGTRVGRAGKRTTRGSSGRRCGRCHTLIERGFMIDEIANYNAFARGIANSIRCRAKGPRRQQRPHCERQAERAYSLRISDAPLGCSATAQRGSK